MSRSSPKRRDSTPRCALCRSLETITLLRNAVTARGLVDDHLFFKSILEHLQHRADILASYASVTMKLPEKHVVSVCGKEVSLRLAHELGTEWKDRFSEQLEITGLGRVGAQDVALSVRL